jgi:alpha-1,2-mannosyltransferase
MKAQRPLERPGVRRAAAIALAILILVFAIQTWRKAHRPDGNDLTSYLSAARALAAGASPYAVETPFPYIYPLFSALVLIPVAVLPYGASVLLWYALSVAALGWTFTIFARRESRGVREADAVSIAALVVLLAIDVVQNNLLNGQINFLVLACCAAALAAAQGPPAASWWGAAIAAKVLPLALGPWWLLRRRLLVVAGAIGIAIALSLAPVLVAGPTALDWTRAYVRGFLGGSLEVGVRSDTIRFSLFGVLEPYAGWLPWLPLLCALIVVAAAAAADMRRRSPGDDHVGYALYLAAIPLASPKSETHHLAFALPAAYVCALRLLRSSTRAADWRPLAVLTGAGLFLAGSLFPAVRNWCWFLALVLLCGVTAGLRAARQP